MQRLEFSGAVRPIYESLGVKRLTTVSTMRCQSQWPRQLACWECGFESRRRYGYLSPLSLVWCQVKISATGWSLVQRSSTECGVPECDRESSIMWKPWPSRGCCAMEEGTKHNGMNLNLRKYYPTVFLEVLLTCRNRSYDIPSTGGNSTQCLACTKQQWCHFWARGSSLDVSHIPSPSYCPKKDDMSNRIREVPRFNGNQPHTIACSVVLFARASCELSNFLLKTDNQSTDPN